MRPNRHTTRKEDARVILRRVTKQYHIHHEKPILLERLIRTQREAFRALSDITVTLYRGEKVGLLGPNGSGKTTLLKIISGIVTPTNGDVIAHGRVVPIIDLEAGFHPDLTGEQNIYLNGLMLGMTRREITICLRKIIAYAHIGRFIDVPLFTYSQGMKLRLGLSIAIHAQPDILLLDEGIGAGDETFQRKAQKTIHSMFQTGKTIIVASHWLEFLERYCTRILVLDRGHIVADGSSELVSWYRKKYGNT
ncbi:ABC transporter ATP-binding protein [Candidatus Gottesmanbacteria bacterium]|nr:ABC transporter ATP-binding protein [Candidatus Gottesmanbacteria bacterium]